MSEVSVKPARRILTTKRGTILERRGISSAVVPDAVVKNRWIADAVEISRNERGRPSCVKEHIE